MEGGVPLFRGGTTALSPPPRRAPGPAVGAVPRGVSTLRLSLYGFVFALPGYRARELSSTISSWRVGFGRHRNCPAGSRRLRPRPLQCSHARARPGCDAAALSFARLTSGSITWTRPVPRLRLRLGASSFTHT